MKRLSSFGFISNQSSVEKRARSDIVRTIIIRASGSMGGVSSGCGRGFKNCARYTCYSYQGEPFKSQPIGKQETYCTSYSVIAHTYTISHAYIRMCKNVCLNKVKVHH